MRDSKEHLPNEWNGCHEIPIEGPLDVDQVILHVTMITLAIAAFCIIYACNHKPQAETTVNSATEALIASTGQTLFDGIWATTPVQDVAEDGTVVGFDFASANLALTKVKSENGVVLIVFGCHNDDLSALQGRFEHGLDLKEKNRFEFKFTSIVDTTDDQTLAEFEGGILKKKHSDIRVLVPRAVPVIVFGDDGEIIFQGGMLDEESSFPTIPSPQEPAFLNV